MTTPAASRPRRSGDATRHRLRRAALDLFTTIGFRATTTPALAAAAGVAEGTIYRHFKGKEELLNEVYREQQEWAAGQLAELEQERILRMPDRLEALARRMLASAAADPAAMRMLLQTREERHLDERSREAAGKFRSGLQQMMASGKSDGLVRSGPAELWAAVWLAVVSFAVERVASGDWPPDHPQTGLVIQAAWDAVASRPQATSESPGSS